MRLECGDIYLRVSMYCLLSGYWCFVFRMNFVWKLCNKNVHIFGGRGVIISTSRNKIKRMEGYCNLLFHETTYFTIVQGNSGLRIHRVNILFFFWMLSMNVEFHIWVLHLVEYEYAHFLLSFICHPCDLVIRYLEKMICESGVVFKLKFKC